MWKKTGYIVFWTETQKTNLLVKWNSKADGQDIYFCDSDKQVYAVVTEISADFEKVIRLYIFSKEEKEYTCIDLDFAETDYVNDIYEYNNLLYLWYHSEENSKKTHKAYYLDSDGMLGEEAKPEDTVYKDIEESVREVYASVIPVGDVLRLPYQMKHFDNILLIWADGDKEKLVIYNKLTKEKKVLSLSDEDMSRCILFDGKHLITQYAYLKFHLTDADTGRTEEIDSKYDIVDFDESGIYYEEAEESTDYYKRLEEYQLKYATWEEVQLGETGKTVFRQTSTAGMTQYFSAYERDFFSIGEYLYVKDIRDYKLYRMRYSKDDENPKVIGEPLFDSNIFKLGYTETYLNETVCEDCGKICNTVYSEKLILKDGKEKSSIINEYLNFPTSITD